MWWPILGALEGKAHLLSWALWAHSGEIRHAGETERQPLSSCQVPGIEASSTLISCPDTHVPFPSASQPLCCPSLPGTPLPSLQLEPELHPKLVEAALELGLWSQPLFLGDRRPSVALLTSSRGFQEPRSHMAAAGQLGWALLQPDAQDTPLESPLATTRAF